MKGWEIANWAVSLRPVRRGARRWSPEASSTRSAALSQSRAMRSAQAARPRAVVGAGSVPLR